MDIGEIERLRAIADKRQQQLAGAQADLKQCEADILTVDVDKLLTSRLRASTLQEIVSIVTRQLERAEVELAEQRRKNPVQRSPEHVKQARQYWLGQRAVLQGHILSLQHGGHVPIDVTQSANPETAIQNLQRELAEIDAKLEAISA